MRPIVKLLNLNRMGYNDALNIQVNLMKKLLSSIESNPNQCDVNKLENTLILVEHNPVYTIGIRSTNYTNAQENELKQLGAEFIRTNRGGLITFHGPGQLVVYPILYLNLFKGINTVKSYVKHLENTIIDLCNAFSIKSNVIQGLPGVWVNNQRKIAAIGLHCSRNVTMHGIAVNCNVDLNWFGHIIPCGIQDKTVTSISKELNKNISIKDVAPVFIEMFSKNFNCEVQS